MAAGPGLHPAVRWAFALVPFATLAGVLRQVPDGPDGAAMSWAGAAAWALGLLAVTAVHAAAWSRWAEASPNRTLVNEFLVRTWFVLLGLAVVGRGVDTGGVYLALAAGLAVASWCTHYTVLRAQGRYRALESVAQHGLFLLALALSILVAVRFAGP